MASKDGQSALEFIRQLIAKDNALSYGEVKEAADKKGFKIFPIMYGRAKALEGLVKVSKRGTGKAAKAAAKKTANATPAGAMPAAPARRGPGRPRKVQPTGSDLSQLSSILDAVKGHAQERDRYRRVLEQIRGLLESALS